MKVAVISDIHSNNIALNKAIDDIKKIRPDKIIFLGDYITDGPDGNETLRLVKKFGDYCLQGNREEYMLNFDETKRDYANYRPLAYTYDTLTKSSLNYISKLPSTQIVTLGGIKFLLVHGSGYFSSHQTNKEIYASCDKLIEEFDFQVCLFGHTHGFCDFEYKGKRFINPGSIGEPVDGCAYKYIVLELDGSNINIDLKTFSSKTSLKKLRQEMIKSEYYLYNKVWADVILNIIKTGADFSDDFLKVVDKQGGNRPNISAIEFNDIWEKSFKIAWANRKKKD